MPIYEFKCKKCDNTWEVLTNDYKKDTDECPICHDLCTRIMSKNTFKLTGVGWYGNSTHDYSSSDLKDGQRKNEEEEGFKI